MKITYISHSGFLVETEKYVFLFDYFKGTIPPIPKEKKLIVCASHKHHDHFNAEIFQLIKEHEDTLFLLSKDIKMSDGYMDRLQVPENARDKIRYIGKNQELDLNEEIHIETLTSTDEGVAFIISVEEKTIYHAGDLNWWSWRGESEAEYKEMTSAFMCEMKKLEGRTLDVAFIPLDPRQEERFWWGFNTLMRTASVKTAFPMHCWDDYSVIQRLCRMEESFPYRDRIVTITAEGQQFEL
ncbi:MAG: MBL fold metallo-hydrolase [Lachnospiraceae bacterium]|nr:MBL fold metallo-hydrolase [Lachnospiraceae bacterium]